MWKKFRQWYNNETMTPPLSFTAQEISLGGKPFTLRRATEADLDELLEVERHCYAGTTPWDRTSFTNELRKVNDTLYLVLITHDTIIAFIGCWFTTHESHITNLAVEPDYQNAGIGRFLMTWMIRQSQELPSAKLTLEVRVSNEPAKHLYRKLGFQDGNIKKAYYVADNEDALNMLLTLRTTP
ncbi:ribosomal protein S18-alanine N-acetyltransferase [Loigolactobacillus coryniformis]|jgi:ribosomal-protein-alanine N-acetyltransferase|uniref:ribosomal protein S18-alanine N-acetyltransferase n=1 Tax=Loigolactobacillus coryniformis TaxID=1610 RepID=UPI00234244B7|nr:ribosomal protein S18-alanine N-acetyltransferase [Loigolactobacillus coryniformis]MDC4186398.1 ribosomal protein S18-alanine N-acetyltransferase [Loigolactobacillus coryniformis]MDN5951300.1 ribosomal protein S18-alanine N-acetyltransferase [Loigolactobacillus coryniformis]MDN5953587.1 ribosomal protein S18-alanine N-acetyltransferase [Loigolactobacillus coryniformis]